MKRLNIEFVARPLWSLPVAARSRAALIILAVLGLIAAATLTWQVRQLDQQIADVERTLARARHELAARTPPPRPPLLLSEAQVLAINGAIGQLNTPWPLMLDGFESVATPEVALLQIEPDHRRQLVKGVAEAKNHQQMLDYLGALGGAAPFVRAVMSKQEINEKDPNRPLRFTFEALFNDSDSSAAGAADYPQVGR